MSHIASFLVVILGVVMGFFADSINSLTLWITSALLEVMWPPIFKMDLVAI